jgi:hypothetical protein
MNRNAAERFSVLDFFGTFCIKTKRTKPLRGYERKEERVLQITPPFPLSKTSSKPGTLQNAAAC